MTTVLLLRYFWENHLSFGFSNLSCCCSCCCAKVGYGCSFCKMSKKCWDQNNLRCVSALHHNWSRSVIKGALSLARCNCWQPELRQCSSGLSQTLLSVNVRPHTPVDQRHPICYSRNTLSPFRYDSYLTSGLYTEEPVCYKAISFLTQGMGQHSQFVFYPSKPHQRREWEYLRILIQHPLK